MATVHRIKNAKIDMTIRGCIECGTEFSSGWRVAREIKVTIGSKEFYGNVHICIDCDERSETESGGQKALWEDVR